MKMNPWKLSLIPVGMFAFGFALVPLYDVFCAVTGLNGKFYSVSTEESLMSESGEPIEQSLVVNLRLTTDPESRDYWDFQPERSLIAIQSGRMIKTHYELTNPTAEAITIRAVPSIAPGEWAKYLVKIECFCFNEQAIPPGETVELPLQVTLSANTPDDVNHLTLSYRIYRQTGGES